MIVEIIIGVVALLIILGLLIGYVAERREHNKISKLYIQASMKSYVLNKKLEEFAEENSTLKFSENQEFVRFLSDSRDMAFEYIENVQGRLYNLDSAMKKNDPILINTAIESLLDMLPKDEIPNN